MRDQPLLIALVAIQFFVHALGWSMAAHLTQRWRAAEGLFAAFWLLLAAGLMLYVPPWASGSAPRNLGDIFIVGAIAVQHCGMALYWDQRPSDRGYLALLAVSVAMLALSVGLSVYKPGGRVRKRSASAGAKATTSPSRRTSTASPREA